MNARDLEAALRQGAVFYMRHRDVGRGREPHNCIVMNAEPGSDEVLILAIISSKTDQIVRRAGVLKQSPDTLVRITPSDYAPLKVESVVDCNSPQRESLFCLKQELAAGRLEVRETILPAILRKIIAGMKASKLVRPAYKAMLEPKQPQ